MEVNNFVLNKVKDTIFFLGLFLASGWEKKLKENLGKIGKISFTDTFSYAMLEA